LPYIVKFTLEYKKIPLVRNQLFPFYYGKCITDQASCLGCLFNFFFAILFHLFIIF